MGKHSRPGPVNQPSRATPRVDPDNPLAAYEKRRRAPMGVYRRHRPAEGGAAHVRPDEPRVLEEWNGFAYEPAGTAPNLEAARVWANGPRLGDDSGA
ncbi:DUF6087 family protein [Streptomyces sp. 796.1]|uniref:DUF6087 family protein n=1 Tax=Streptomyces sp. 796.1 TaxID=3163029 RepID=UPI0039C98BEE